MKVVVSGSHDWVLYLVMFAISASMHTASVFVMFYFEPQTAGTALEQQPGDAQNPASAPGPVEDALSTWRSRLMGNEDSINFELESKIKRVEQEPGPTLGTAWTRDNALQKIEYGSNLAGAQVQSVHLEKAEVLIELKSTPSAVIADLALLSRLTGVALQRRALAADRLTIDVFNEDGKLGGRFKIRAQTARDLAAGKVTLQELYEEGLR